jgi:hypothetical protein
VATRAKIDKRAYSKLKGFFTEYRKQQNEKATYTIGENICRP